MSILRGNDGEFYIKMPDGTLQTIEVDETNCEDVLLEEFNLSSNCRNSNSSESARQSWTDNEIKCLLQIYKDKKHLFDGTSLKNDNVWSLVSCEMEKNGHINKDSTQCKNKFNNMKKKFKRVKDNNKKSGAGAANFAHLEWFEDMFSREHDITPVAYAESSSSTQIPSTSHVGLENSGDTPPITSKRKRSSNSETIINLLEEMSADRKTYREQREKERKQDREEKNKIQKEAVEAVKEATEVFKMTMEKLIEKL